MSDAPLSGGRGRATVAAHGVPGPHSGAGRPAAPPLQTASAWSFDTLASWSGPLAGEDGFAYARQAHPNARSFELTVAALEGAEDGAATASGMAAVTAALLGLARAGARILCQADAYGGTLALLRDDLARLGLRTDSVDVYDVEAVRTGLSDAAVLLVETVSNPLLREPDLPRLAAACRAAGTRLVVDNTFATPMLRRPLEAGADLVVHSATKFLGGHHDLTAGVVAGSREAVAAARGVIVRMGAPVSAFDAWLAQRGVRTLAIRMERAQESARVLAEALAGSSRVDALHDPGWGALLAFELADGEAAGRFVAALELVELVPSLGGVCTTVSHPATASHRNLGPEERAALGISEGLVRVSVGIEAARDVVADFEQALGRV